MNIAEEELLPENTSLNIGEIKDIPLFSEEANRGGLPPEVVRFREQIAEADAILFATPEYIFSVSARLKNALDWADIPPNLPFVGKPCARLHAWAISTAPDLHWAEHIYRKCSIRRYFRCEK
jgi:chromate reductase